MTTGRTNSSQCFNGDHKQHKLVHWHRKELKKAKQGEKKTFGIGEHGRSLYIKSVGAKLFFINPLSIFFKLIPHSAAVIKTVARGVHF